MDVSTHNPTTGNHETVEDLTRFAANAFAAAGIEYRPARMSKFIRRIHRAGNEVRAAITRYLDNELDARSWAGFELYAVSGYADPTGARAARNVDRARGAR
ncbi:hypothetical protein [uncultured Salinibacterium sp.]|uniref:hypothetical protein n=1 Tax=uncultured Salinibacterium sp. TaxID=459274 RepID=UPI0030D8B3F7